MRITLILLYLGLSASPAAAQSVTAPLPGGDDTILVTGLPHPVGKSGQSISVFGRDEMDTVQGPDLTRLLERAPGVTLNRNGGPGSFTAIHVRGSESEQVLVLIDGVRAADPAAPGGGYDLGNLLMGNVGRVELQRGSNSTIWGSQAIGGVMAVTTGSSPGVRAAAEYGAHNTFYAVAGAALEAGPASLGLQAGRLASGGFSAAANGRERDGFRQTEIAGHAGLTVGGGMSFFARGRYAEGRLQIDGFPAPAFALSDTAEYQDTRQLSGAAGAHFTTADLELTAALSSAWTERLNYDSDIQAQPGYSTDGRSDRAELRGGWKFRDGLALNFGAEREWTRFSTLFDAQRQTAATGAYAQLAYDHGPLHLAGGLRRDLHRDFGGAWSLGGDAAYQLAPRWILTASYGEGFKAPTLFQLHSDFGNAALRPETSRSFDAGVRYQAGPVAGSLIAFRRDTADLIGFVSCFGVTDGICASRPFGTYDNVARARAQGVEIEGRSRLGRDLELAAAYSFLEAVDRTSGGGAKGNQLARRPHNALTLTGDWWRGAARLGVDVRIVSRSFDDPANTVVLNGYAVVTLRGEWQASSAVTLYARLENALDEKYQTAAGYATAGRGAYLGARARL